MKQYTGAYNHLLTRISGLRCPSLLRSLGRNCNGSSSAIDLAITLARFGRSRVEPNSQKSH